MINELELRNRIDEVMSVKKMNPRSVSGDDANFYAKCYLQITKGKTLTIPVILAFIEKVPDLSTEWLFRGTGDMFLTDKQHSHTVSSPNFHIEGDNSVAINGDVSVQQQMIELLINKDNIIAEKDARISELTNTLLEYLR